MTSILKVGGSVITEKDEPETLDDRGLDDVANAVAASTLEDLVVVHGGGSFGHHQADRHGVSETDGTGEASELLDIHGAMKALNGFLLQRFYERTVPAVPIHPLSVAHRSADGELTLPTAQVATMLEEGFLPVIHGDVVAHRGAGATVLSGDELTVELAESLDADHVGMCSGTPGVIDEAGEVIDRVTAFGDVADVLEGGEGSDVTGGMAGKIESLLSLSVDSCVFGVDDLQVFLRGDMAGTRIEGQT